MLVKIGIVTFHFPWNCGAALQCVALQTYLEQQGHEVCIINYRPLYHENRYSEFKHPLYLARRAAHDAGPKASKLSKVKKAGIAYAKTIKSWTRHNNYKPQAQKFAQFQHDFLHETKRYRSIEELRADAPDCDLYISGSDQLWNAKITDGRFDPVYFMDFGPKTTGRITYSIGAEFSGVDHPMAKLVPLIRSIDAIALREEKYLPTVQETCVTHLHQPEKPLAITIDPTLLLNRESYEKLATPERLKAEPYIFTYTMPSKSQVKANKTALDFGEKMGLPVVDASGSPNIENRKMPDTRICSPSEFLAYIRDAEYVVTSSFHGTVFAIIFQKPFVAIPHPDTGNRIIELLEKLGLSDRLAFTIQDALTVLEQPMSYSACEKLLPQLQQSSYDYLQKSIQTYGRH